VPGGEWRVARGEWRGASGEWRVASGEWRVASGEFVAVVLRHFRGFFENRGRARATGKLCSPLRSESLN